MRLRGKQPLPPTGDTESTTGAAPQAIKQEISGVGDKSALDQMRTAILASITEKRANNKAKPKRKKKTKEEDPKEKDPKKETPKEAKEDPKRKKPKGKTARMKQRASEAADASKAAHEATRLSKEKIPKANSTRKAADASKGKTKRKASKVKLASHAVQEARQNRTTMEKPSCPRISAGVPVPTVWYNGSKIHASHSTQSFRVFIDLTKSNPSDVKIRWDKCGPKAAWAASLERIDAARSAGL